MKYWREWKLLFVIFSIIEIKKKYEKEVSCFFCVCEIVIIRLIKTIIIIIIVFDCINWIMIKIKFQIILIETFLMIKSFDHSKTEKDLWE